MKYFILISLLFIGLDGVCQSTKMFFDKDHKPVEDSTKARYYMLVQKLNDTAWTAIECQTNGILLSMGTYKDEKLQMQNGLFTYFGYDLPRDLSDNHYFFYAEAIGSFENGKKSGDWIFYNSDGLRHVLSNYRKGQLTGLYQSYADSNKVLAEGYYRMGKRIGDWPVYDKDGRVILTDTYLDGNVINTVRTNPDSPGSVLTKEKMQDARPNCDFKTYLANEIKKVITKDVNGQLLLQFVIGKNGQLINPIILKRLGNDVNRSVGVITTKSCTWQPAHMGEDTFDQVIYCAININNSIVIVNYASNLQDVSKK